MIVSIASFKGGVGKTTTAIHLAGFLATRASTLLVDGDPNRSCLDWAKSGNFQFTTIDVLQLAKFAGKFDHTVIDTKARPDEDDLEMLSKGCDRLVIPTTPDALAIQATLKMLSALKSLHADSYKILLTMIPPPPSHDGKDAERVLKDNGLPVFKTQIRRYTAYKKAALQKILVSDVKDAYAKESSKDCQRFGKEVLK